MIHLINVLLAFRVFAIDVIVATESESSKANNYLIEKWEQWFALNDNNQDGMLSLDDVTLFEGRFYKDLDEKEKTAVEEINRLFKLVILDNNDELSEDDFVEMIKQRYESNKTAFTEMIRLYITEWNKVVDLDNDNFISEEEFVMDMDAAGHKDTAKQFFSFFKPKNGRVPVEAIISNFIRFIIDGDRSKPGIIKIAFDSCF